MNQYKPRLWDYILVTLLMGLIAAMIFMTLELRSPGAQCTANPLEYGVKYYTEKLNASTMCTCSTFGNGMGGSWEVTTNGSRLIQTAPSGSGEVPFDWGKVNITG